MSGYNYATKDGKPDPEERAAGVVRELLREARSRNTTGEITVTFSVNQGGLTGIKKSATEIVK